MNQQDSDAGGVLSRPPFIVALSGLTAFVVYALLCPDALASGDPAVYLDQMVSQRFGGRTVHLGYLWLGAGYVSVFPASDLSFNMLHSFLAAVAVMLVGGIAAQLTRKRWAIAAASLAAMVHLMVMEGAVHAEVYLPQCMFLLAVCLLVIRPVLGLPSLLLGSACLAMAVLITPSSLFLVPSLFILRPKMRDMALLSTIGALLTVVALSGSWDDYLLSPRGLLQASGSIGFRGAVTKEVYEVFRGFAAMLPFLLAGGVACWRQSGRGFSSKRYLAALMTAFLVSFALGERFSDVPVQLPTYLLAMPLIALAIDWLPDSLTAATGQRRLGAVFAGAVLGLGPLAALLAVRSRSRPLSALPDFLLPTLLIILALAFAVSAYLLVVAYPRARAQGSKLSRVVVALFLLCALATGSISTFWMIGQNREMVELKARLVATERLLDDDALLVSTWSQGILFEHYNGLEIYSGVFVEGPTLASEPAELNAVRLEEIERFEAQLTKGKPVLVMTESDEARAKLDASGYQSRPLEGYAYYTR